MSLRQFHVSGEFAVSFNDALLIEMMGMELEVVRYFFNGLRTFLYKGRPIISGRFILMSKHFIQAPSTGKIMRKC